MVKPWAKYVPSLLYLWKTLANNEWADIAKASVAAGRIIDMRGKDQVDGKLISLDIGNIGDDDMGVKIQFQNVWFRYPTRDVPILNGLNLTVSKDRQVRPDTIRLLLTFYPPDRERTVCRDCWSIRQAPRPGL
jgi:ABC-type multidrug transport system fused ATPase/permease subunit